MVSELDTDGQTDLESSPSSPTTASAFEFNVYSAAD